jgi:N-formylglutamate deformylase
MGATFELLEPTGPETPVIVEIPHAGLDVPPQFLAQLVAPARAIGRDADLFVDRLYEDAPAQGASLLVARTSRYAVDLNRAETDADAEVVEGGRSDVSLHHGLVWRTTSDGETALAGRLTRAQLEERLNLLWRPYHQALAAAVAGKRSRFGVAVVLAAHSMPSVERGAHAHAAADGRVARQRADVVPGTRGRKSAAGPLIDAVESHALARGWTVRHDEPYAGGFTTQHYGRPADGVHVVQVELSRRLYLDEATLRMSDAFDGVRTWCRELVAALGVAAVGMGAGTGTRAGQRARP